MVFSILRAKKNTLENSRYKPILDDLLNKDKFIKMIDENILEASNKGFCETSVLLKDFNNKVYKREEISKLGLKKEMNELIEFLISEYSNEGYQAFEDGFNYYLLKVTWEEAKPNIFSKIFNRLVINK